MDTTSFSVSLSAYVTGRSHGSELLRRAGEALFSLLLLGNAVRKSSLLSLCRFHDPSAASGQHFLEDRLCSYRSYSGIVGTLEAHCGLVWTSTWLSTVHL